MNAIASNFISKIMYGVLIAATGGNKYVFPLTIILYLVSGVVGMIFYLVSTKKIFVITPKFLTVSFREDKE